MWPEMSATGSTNVWPDVWTFGIEVVGQLCAFYRSKLPVRSVRLAMQSR